MKSVRWVLAAIVAGLLVLSGCSNPGAGVAASVNGVSIPVSRIEEPVKAIGNSDGQLAEPHAIVLSYAIRGEIARSVAAEQNIPLTGEPRTTVLNANPNLAQYAENPQVAGFVDDVVDSTLVINRIGETAFVEQVSRASVQVNPRYGSWSIEAAAVAQAGGQLSKPWATPTPPA
ncbi:MAG TPA: hypothetical protein PKE46_14500 [Micropruina sp.]|nr:hypothetical protein [Propionibacterium sp.]HMQ38406.1 hypothetical protein [Micropruina sp.]HMR23343.1 hypothetical protein [Micropruina sp.]